MAKKKKIQPKKLVSKKLVKKPIKKVVINKKKKNIKPAKARKVLVKSLKTSKAKFKIVKKIKAKPKAKKLKKKTIVKKPVNQQKTSKAKFRWVKKIKKEIIVKKSPAKKIVKKSIKKPIKRVAKKLVVKKVTNKIEPKAKTEFPAEALFRAKIKVIGVGGGGGSIVSEIGKSLEKATFMIADTDIRALKKRSGMKYFWFGEGLTHGLGTGVNVELAQQVAQSAKERMSSFFKDQDIIIFVASLGGGLGSGATQVFAEAAKEFGGITFGIFTMPFKFEGKIKQKIAQNALKSLIKSLNVSLVIPNEKIFKIIDESTPITNAFSTVNKSLIESLESLIDLIYSPGVINIDFADLRTILRGRGNMAFLNTVEESGKNSVDKICENIFKNPLLQTGNFKAEKVLFNIAGGDELSMFQVEKISRHISELNPKAKIIFGISKNYKLKHKIKTTILMTGPSPEYQTGDDAVAVKEEILPEIKAVKESEPEKKVIIENKVIKKEKIGIIKKNKVIKKSRIIPAAKIVKKLKPVITHKIDKKIGVFEPIAIVDNNAKRTIRRSGLEIREAEEMIEKKRIAQEQEWEIPAFLRKVKS